MYKELEKFVTGKKIEGIGVIQDKISESKEHNEFTDESVGVKQGYIDQLQAFEILKQNRSLFYKLKRIYKIKRILLIGKKLKKS